MAKPNSERQSHPLVRRNYRVATTAIEAMVTLTERCLRVLIPGALVYARPRMGKTHAIEYVCIHLARARPDVLTVRMSCEHHKVDFEGNFFNSLLTAVGTRAPKNTISAKREALVRPCGSDWRPIAATLSSSTAMKHSGCPETPMNGFGTSTTSSPTTESG